MHDIDCVDSCMFEADADLYYDETVVIEDLSTAFSSWLNGALADSAMTFSVISSKVTIGKPQAAAQAEMTEINPKNNSGTGIVLGAGFAGVVFIGLAFLIHRKYRQSNDDFPDFQTTSEGELFSVRSNQSGKSWRNIFDSSKHITNNGTNLPDVENDSEVVSFPVNANVLDTEYEVSNMH